MAKTTNYNFDKQKWGHQIKEDDLNRIAANLDLIDAAIKVRADAISDLEDVSLRKLSTTTVPFNATGQTTLYTVLTGKTFIPIMAIIRAGANAALTDVTFGRVGALTDWMGTIQLDNLDADGDQVKIEVANSDPPTKSKTYAAGVVFQIDVTVAQGGATNYVDLFGYLI